MSDIIEKKKEVKVIIYVSFTNRIFVIIKSVAVYCRQNILDIVLELFTLF